LRDRLSALWASVRRTQSSRKRRLVVSLMVAVVSLGFLSVALYTQRDTLLNHLREANGWLVLLTLIIYPIGLLPVAVVWHELMVGLGGCADLRTNLRNYALSAIPKRIPGAVWHVASRVVLYDANGTSPVLTVSATVLETLLLILTGLALFAVPALAGSIRGVSGLGQAIAGFAFPALIVLAVAWRPLAQRVLRLLSSDSETMSWSSLGWRQMVGVYLTCVVAWIGGGLLLFLMSRAFTDIPISELPVFVGIWGGAGAVSLIAGFLVQGMGLREITLAVLLSGYMPLSVAVAVALLFRILLSVGEFVWAIVLARLSADREPITRREY